MLERRQEGYQSKRYKAIEKFFKSAVSVVPLESLFHAIANAEPDVVLQCCEIFSSCSHIVEYFSSDFVVTSIEHALSRICCIRSSYEIDETTQEVDQRSFLAQERECQNLVRIRNTVKKCKRQTRKKQHPSYGIDLEVIYPSVDVKDARKHKDKCFKAPMTLLTEGRKELNRLSEELIAEQCSSTDASLLSNTNIKMLSALQKLRKEFETCSTLLGAFMQAQVQIPLEKAGGDKYVNKLAKHASSFGLSVWGLFILPFGYLNSRIISYLPEDFRQFVVEFSRNIHGIHNYMFPSSEHQFEGYDERLEFLVGSMKQSWTCNQNYVSYSLERQLEDQCKKRNIYHNTPVDEILKEWNDNFENETLTLVPDKYRILIARWIKWSLMINNLRESLASQTAVGVIGLVNSGKSKFVRSLFGEQVNELLF